MLILKKEYKEFREEAQNSPLVRRGVFDHFFKHGLYPAPGTRVAQSKQLEELVSSVNSCEILGI